MGFISSHNAEYENGLHDFSVGENEFTDMTPDEITSYFNGLIMDRSIRMFPQSLCQQKWTGGKT